MRRNSEKHREQRARQLRKRVPPQVGSEFGKALKAGGKGNGFRKGSENQDEFGKALK